MSGVIVIVGAIALVVLLAAIIAGVTALVMIRKERRDLGDDTGN
jgi:hypothetical protein